MSNSLHYDQTISLRSIVAPTLFGEVDEPTRIALLAEAPLRTFASGQIIQQRGDGPRGFWVIEEGTVKIGQFKADGDFRVIVLLGGGDSYGELAVFANAPRAVDAVADSDVTARWIDAARFERGISGNPATLRRLVGALSVQLQEILDLLAGLGAGSGHARIAATLANLARQLPAGVMVAINQQELGELTGLTRATVNKSLKRLEQQGAIKRHYGKLELLDLQLLADAARGA
jgi:CRP-like cAMP-binding protein